MPQIHNVHRRVIDAPAERLTGALTGLGSSNDVLWPRKYWVPMVLDGPLGVGADGGHGPIRYRVIEHQPGRMVRFGFTPGHGLEGAHELTVQPLSDGRSAVQHVLMIRAFGRLRLIARPVILPLHNAVLEDLLDNAERIATGSVRRPASWSWWVRLLRACQQTVDGEHSVRARTGTDSSAEPSTPRRKSHP